MHPFSSCMAMLFPQNTSAAWTPRTSLSSTLRDSMRKPRRLFANSRHTLMASRHRHLPLCHRGQSYQ